MEKSTYVNAWKEQRLHSSCIFNCILSKRLISWCPCSANTPHNMFVLRHFDVDSTQIQKKLTTECEKNRKKQIQQEKNKKKQVENEEMAGGTMKMGRNKEIGAIQTKPKKKITKIGAKVDLCDLWTYPFELKVEVA